MPPGFALVPHVPHQKYPIDFTMEVPFAKRKRSCAFKDEIQSLACVQKSVKQCKTSTFSVAFLFCFLDRGKFI